MGSLSRPGNLWHCSQCLRGDIRHHYFLLQLLARRHAGHCTEDELQHPDDGECRVVCDLLLRGMGEKDFQGAYCGDFVDTNECEATVGSRDEAGKFQGDTARRKVIISGLLRARCPRLKSWRWARFGTSRERLEPLPTIANLQKGFRLPAPKAMLKK